MMNVAIMYAELINLGVLTMDDVPDILKERTEQALEQIKSQQASKSDA